MAIGELDLPDEQVDRLRAIADEVAAETGAIVVAIADAGGRPIVVAGDPAELDMLGLVKLARANASTAERGGRLSASSGQLAQDERRVLHVESLRGGVLLAVKAANASAAQVRRCVAAIRPRIEEIFAHCEPPSDEPPPAAESALRRGR